MELVDRIFSDNEADKKYEKLGVKFNPFPRSGTANINSSDLFNQKLVPVDEKIKDKIVDFVRHALVDNPLAREDKFISATITGNYGSGKTQLLMFVKYLLGEVSAVHKGQRNPYVIYIDNPGVKLLELIGAIISKIGEENFKKFIWAKLINKIKSTPEHRKRLSRFESGGAVLFRDTNPNPYSDENSVSHKKFLDSFVRFINSSKQRKEFENTFKEVLLSILESEVGNSIVAQYFYQLISEDGIMYLTNAARAGVRQFPAIN